ncbi:hypothetical protein BX600DRAFT_477535 [Xylariales sp. PMI_506]|nr:hypothetical protein BX600DRAFT_477535 [Xylariales sp. PMI_506]
MAEADRAPALRVIDIFFFSLATLTILLRCGTRVMIVRAMGADDWLMLVAMCFYTLYVISGLISVAHGSGQRQASLSDYDRSIALEHWWLCYIWYDMTMIFSRLSIGIFFLRLTIKRIHLWIIYLIMISTVAFGVIFLGVAIGECTPASYFWDKDQNGWCMDTKIIVALMYLYSASSLFSDATYAIFPIFLMRGLQMDRRTRWGLIPILGLGWIASIAVMARFAFLTALDSGDLTYNALPIAILSSCEQGLAIAAGNLATLRPLFTRTFGFWGSTVPPNSNDNFPPTIGALDRARGYDGTPNGSIGLGSFLRGLDQASGAADNNHVGHDPKSNGISVSTDITITTNNRNSLWAQEASEREEELRAEPSSETLNEDGMRAIPVSFLAKPR